MKIQSLNNNSLKKFFGENRSKIILTVILGGVSGATALLDVIVLDLLNNIEINNLDASNNVKIFIYILSKSLLAVLINLTFALVAFNGYKDLVMFRFSKAFVLNGFIFPTKELVNYTLNESMQVVLTIVIPIYLLTSAVVQILILVIGSSFILSGNSGFLMLILAVCYMAYMIPTQVLLRKLGQNRRAADELRLDFVSNVASSFQDFRLLQQRDAYTEKFLKQPTIGVRNALVVKWVNSESQKNILEITALISFVIFTMMFSNSSIDMQLVAPMLFLGYRIAPLFSRLTISIQSMIFGIASIDEPVNGSNHLSVSVELKHDREAALKFLNLSEPVDKLCSEKTNGITLITGESGVGKSTLMNDAALLRSLTKRVAFTGQYPFIAKLSLSGNLPKILNDDIIKDFGLDEIMRRKSLDQSEISIGQAQRISILRALLSDADELYFDEPFSAINIQKIDIVCHYLNQAAKAKPIFIISHIRPEKLEVKNELHIKKL